jgi:hypothetical protein
MSNESLIWLAGFIDGDGSIHIGVREQQTSGTSYIAIRPVLNVTQHIDCKWICDYIKKELGIGNVYVANRSNAQAKATWQTLRIDDMIKVLELIQPYLKLKKRQADMALPVLKAWSAEIKAGKAGKNTYGGERLRSRKTVMDIVKVATSLNSHFRTSAYSRGYKTFKEWKPIINRLYPR